MEKALSGKHNLNVKESRFFMDTDFSDYSGKWVAISGAKIISSSPNIKKTIKDAKAQGKEYSLAKIPTKNQVLLL